MKNRTFITTCLVFFFPLHSNQVFKGRITKQKGLGFETQN
jgi:hypothetical protein